eukprot:s6344_g4.t1
MWLRVLLPTCDAAFGSRDDQSNGREAKMPHACFVATQLIFPYPSVPDGVTLRSGFVEAMPRVVPRLGKDVNFEAFSSAFAERQVVFVRSAARQARKPGARRRRIGLALLRQLYSDMASVRNARNILAASLAFIHFNVCTGDSTCDVRTQSEIEKIELNELQETNVELLQTALAVTRLERKSQEVYAPHWCYTISDYVRSSIAACNGGVGSCICMGPEVCGSWGPFPPGSWQAYSYSCCACHPGVQQPAAPTAPVPASTPAQAVPPAAGPPQAAGAESTANASNASASSACAVHRACADLRLDGACCPSADGTYLGCCDVSASMAQLDAAALDKPSRPIPAWCAEMSRQTRENSPPCTSSGPSSCACISKTACGDGPPLAGSWQHYSTACRAFNLESSGSLLASEAPNALDRLLGSKRTPPGSWYASFVLQRSRKALSEFFAQTIPAGAPKFLVERPPRNGSAAIKLPKHSNAAWVFFGRNPGSRILRGRPEHTDAIQHSGTWHVQLKGEKVWTLKPTDELRRKVPSLKTAGRVRVRCMEGDVLCINTRLWWHSTHIPARCKLSLSVARDMYLDGTRPGACDMTNVDGHYALKPIQKGAVIFTEDTAPQLELPRSSASNCELRESQRGSLVVVAKRVIKKGEWFSLSDSDAEAARAEEPRGAKRKR